MFQNLVAVLDQIDPAKLNSTLSALADGVRGQGERIGQATTDANRGSARAESAQRDHHAPTGGRCDGFSDTYSAAAQDILATLDAASTTSTTVINQSRAPGCVAAVHHWAVQQRYRPAGAQPGQPDQGDQRAGADDEPAVQVQPRVHLPAVRRQVPARHTAGTRAPAATATRSSSTRVWPSATTRTTIPQNLPIIGAKGGPGGKPGCGSLPDVVEELAGATPGHQHRLRHRSGLAPQPGHRLPGLRQLPAGDPRGPEPPSIRNLFGGPAIGPIPYPGAPAYGAPLYAPDGTPLWPGLPPAPPPGAPQGPRSAPGIRAVLSCRTRRDWQPTPSPYPFTATPGSGHPGPLTRTARPDRTTKRGNPHDSEHPRRRNWRLARLPGRVPARCVRVCSRCSGSCASARSPSSYRAEFTNVTGLETDDFVRIAGVEVGKVKKIAIQPDTTALVEFTADDSVVLTEGSRAVIRYDDLIGGRYLALEEGAGGTRQAQPGRHHSAGPHLTGAGPRRADRRVPAAVPGPGSRPGQCACPAS